MLKIFDAIALRDNNLAVKESELIVIAVKPFHFPQLLVEVEPENWRDKIIVSVMAGVRLETLRATIPGASIFRAMPNFNAYVGSSSTAVAENRFDDTSRIVEEF